MNRLSCSTSNVSFVKQPKSYVHASICHLFPGNESCRIVVKGRITAMFGSLSEAKRKLQTFSDDLTVAVKSVIE